MDFCEIVFKGKVWNVLDDVCCCEIFGIYFVDIMYFNILVVVMVCCLMYGNFDIVRDILKFLGKIFKIVYLVWYWKKEMDFMMYLSFRSVMIIFKLEKVFIYGDNFLYGKYFDKFKKDFCVYNFYWEVLGIIFGYRVFYI